MGYGNRFNDALQFNASIGRTYGKADTGLGGSTKAQSTYVLPELIVSLPSSVLATISGYYGKGRADIDRVYLNAGTPERSFADPSLTSMGARVRFDWLNAASLGKTKLTPYASLTYLETKMDGYAEQRVAFPVIWDARTEHPTTARIGLDAVRPISDRLTVLGWVGLGWVGLGWVGLGWVGLGWVGLGWVGLGRVGSGRVGSRQHIVSRIMLLRQRDSWVDWILSVLLARISIRIGCVSGLD